MTTLVVLPSLAAVRTPNGVLVTRKFVEGMHSYCERWPGKVKTVMNVADSATNNLDNIEVRPGTLPFDIEVVSFQDRAAVLRAVSDAGIVLSTPHHHLHGLSRDLRQRGIVSVMCTEYSLRTRLDIVRAETPDLMRAARRAAWEVREEFLTRQDLQAAHGVQCNGTPTYDAYHGLTDALLYFDSRVEESSYATDADMVDRAMRLQSGAPLQIAFSGRLIEIKGAHHLIPLARTLRDLGVNFDLSIYGGGALSQEIQRLISWNGLPRYMAYKGVVDFHTELLPTIRNKIDLFVAPHLQGDPSCTYLETMACGIPIVGYDNEAWQGVLNRDPVGWSTPMGNPRKLAKKIAELNNHRTLIITKSWEAHEFALRHTFEKTFDRRVEHLCGLVRRYRPTSANVHTYTTATI